MANFQKSLINKLLIVIIKLINKNYNFSEFLFYKFIFNTNLNNQLTYINLVIFFRKKYNFDRKKKNNLARIIYKLSNN